MQRYEIEGFREIIPSMHDIFLANVNDAPTYEEDPVNHPA